MNGISPKRWREKFTSEPEDFEEIDGADGSAQLVVPAEQPEAVRALRRQAADLEAD